MKKGKNSIYNRYIKRILDYLISIVSLIVLSPVFLTLVFVGAVKMKGNPFFTQPRSGKVDPKTGSEKIFKLVKFRSMTNLTDEDGNLLPDEKRLNRYGSFLRSSSLDELPELINILKGDMSIIGPRPLLVEYIPYYSNAEKHRHDVLPGITGLAQISGRNFLSWEEKFVYDIKYVNEVSFFLDVDILFKTIVKVLLRNDIEESNNVEVDEDGVKWCVSKGKKQRIYEQFDKDRQLKEHEIQ